VKHKERMHASLKTCVMLDAMIALYHEGVVFTVQGFCAKFAYTPNRHVREALNAMARQGLCMKQKKMFDDGHYRMIYTAPPKRLPGFPS